MINIQHTKLQIHGCLLIMVKPKWILHYWCLKCFYSDMAPECRDDKLWPISRCSIHPWSCYLHLVKDSPRTIAGKMGRSPSELIITIRKLYRWNRQHRLFFPSGCALPLLVLACLIASPRSRATQSCDHAAAGFRWTSFVAFILSLNLAFWSGIRMETLRFCSIRISSRRCLALRAVQEQQHSGLGASFRRNPPLVSYSLSSRGSKSQQASLQAATTTAATMWPDVKTGRRSARMVIGCGAAAEEHSAAVSSAAGAVLSPGMWRWLFLFVVKVLPAFCFSRQHLHWSVECMFWCCVRVSKLDLFFFWRFLLRSAPSGDGLGFPFWDWKVCARCFIDF